MIGTNKTKFSVPGTGKSDPTNSPMDEMQPGARSGKSVLAKRSMKKGSKSPQLGRRSKGGGR